MDQWLVRTANNIIAGPYSREQVVRLIQDGKLGLQDEVCQANHYWIMLHEHQEVLDQLGIHLPRAPRGEDDEVTETQTEAIPAGAPAGASAQDDISPTPQAPADYEGGTAVLSRGSFRESKSAAGSAVTHGAHRSTGAPFSPGAVTGMGRSHEVHIERPAIWRSFAWLLIVAACLLVVVVLRLLRAPHY